MLLSPGADGKPYPNGVRIATNAARMWKLNSHETGDANDLPFWDTHSFDLTRMYNWECWIYGSDPAGDGNIVAAGDLPEDRAGGCQEEFSKMSEAWARTSSNDQRAKALSIDCRSCCLKSGLMFVAKVKRSSFEGGSTRPNLAHCT